LRIQIETRHGHEDIKHPPPNSGIPLYSLPAVPVRVCRHRPRGGAWSAAAGTGANQYQPVVITFDGPPVIRPGTSRIVQGYNESGMAFTPIDPDAPWAGFGRMGSNPPVSSPDNGTAYLKADSLSTLKFVSTTHLLFGLLAVDLAEYSTVALHQEAVLFIGYRYDGVVLTTTHITDGIMDGTGPLADFQTFHFGPEWSDLERVEIPTPGWSLDNLVIGRPAVPEPASGTLLGVGGLALWCLRQRRCQLSGCRLPHHQRGAALCPHRGFE